MDKELGLLLSSGYLPANELPKVFSTSAFANYYVKNRHSISLLKKATKCIRLSCPKVGLSRKSFKIPNPIHYGDLCSFIIENWKTLNPIFEDSSISNSKPELTEQAMNKPLYNFRFFSRSCVRDSYKYMYELNTDISKFYPSIYTHSVAWAIDTKEKSKDPKLRKGLVGDKLDRKIRLMQDDQTIGIPIGPYCSQIISELISCKIDKGLKETVKYLIGHRFIDDRKLYFDDYNDAELCYNALLSQLSYYELEPNTSKTIIKKLPIPINPNWIIDIQNFNFRSVNPEPETSFKTRKKTIQETDLINFFSIVFNLGLEFPNDYIFKYSIKVIKKIEIVDENIDLFESLIYKSLLTESSIIIDIVDLLIHYKEKINIDKLSILLHQFIDLHSNKGHDFELIWALFISRIFKIKIRSSSLMWVDRYSNSFLKYIIQDLFSCSMIEGKFSIDILYKNLSSEDLLNEDWFYTYHAYYHEFSDCDFSSINEPEYQLFKRLKANKIEFYDPEVYTQLINDKSIDKSNIKNEKEAPAINEDKKPEMFEYLIY
jgi:hypothetical protein